MFIQKIGLHLRAVGDPYQKKGLKLLAEGNNFGCSRLGFSSEDLIGRALQLGK